MMGTESVNMSFVQPSEKSTFHQRLGMVVGTIGLLILLVSFCGVGINGPLWLGVSLTALLIAPVIFGVGLYRGKTTGIKNDGVWNNGLTSRGAIGWMLGVFLTGFYVLLYWFPTYLGLGKNGTSNTGLIKLFDPLSLVMNGSVASEWFVYGTLYTVAILGLGVKFILKYRHNRYQIARTLSVMILQLFLAYLIPEILQAMNQELAYFGKDIKNMWPLN
ncbi:MAG: FeS-binding protein, partial [Flavobacteriales bacterium]|nr:FeS-binding protein [Flavobacteriales bacterium]